MTASSIRMFPYGSPIQPVALGRSESSRPMSADELCDEMMLHVFTCTTCLNESEDACSNYQALKQKMESAEGPVHGRFLAM